jgi:hypothetical protein
LEEVCVKYAFRNNLVLEEWIALVGKLEDGVGDPAREVPVVEPRAKWEAYSQVGGCHRKGNPSYPPTVEVEALRDTLLAP